jgi:hypothetical protein
VPSLFLVISVLVTEMRAAPRLRRAEEFFQPKDLVWLDPCDEHRDEKIKQAAARIPNLNRPQSISRKSV